MFAHLQVSFTVLGHLGDNTLGEGALAHLRPRLLWEPSKTERVERYTNIRNPRQSRRGEAATRVPDRYHSSFYSISPNFHRHHLREASRIATNE